MTFDEWIVGQPEGVAACDTWAFGRKVWEAATVKGCLTVQEAEVLQAQEPVGSIERCAGGYYRDSVVICAPFDRPVWTDGKMPPVGTMLYAAPQPPAPCPECERSRNTKRIAEENELSASQEIDALQAKVGNLEYLLAACGDTKVKYMHRISDQSALIEQLNTVAVAYEQQVVQHNLTLDYVQRQAKMIEKCEQALLDNSETWDALDRRKQALAAIAAHRAAIAEAKP